MYPLVASSLGEVLVIVAAPSCDAITRNQSGSAGQLGRKEEKRRS